MMKEWLNKAQAGVALFLMQRKIKSTRLMKKLLRFFPALIICIFLFSCQADKKPRNNVDKPETLNSDSVRDTVITAPQDNTQVDSTKTVKPVN